MRAPHVSEAWRMVSPRHRKVHSRRDPAEILVLVVRLVAVGLLVAIGWVHLHLWQQGYRYIPIIGPLFLAAAVSAVAVAVGLLGRPSRLVGLAGIGVVMGTLAGLIVSVNLGLFGFRESLLAPFAVESVGLEAAAAATLAAWMAVDLMAEVRNSGRRNSSVGALVPTDEGAGGGLARPAA